MTQLTKDIPKSSTANTLVYAIILYFLDYCNSFSMPFLLAPLCPFSQIPPFSAQNLLIDSNYPLNKIHHSLLSYNLQLCMFMLLPLSTSLSSSHITLPLSTILNLYWSPFLENTKLVLALRSLH